ncbi:MAG: hypothetical protein M1817_005782 [Caeruleum heppii]|nr:MAG: hypothetical protein M1817_005782 [Caeruleum heppii]
MSSAKECYFSATRRKRRPTDGGDGSLDDEVEDDYELRNSRKKLRTSSEEDRPDLNALSGSRPHAPFRSTPVHPTRGTSVGASNSSLAPPAGHTVAGTPTTRSAGPAPSGSNDYSAETSPVKVTADDAGDDDQHLTKRLWETEVYNGHDALNLLFEAAGRTGDLGHHRVGSHGSVKQSPTSLEGIKAGHATLPITSERSMLRLDKPATSTHARPHTMREPLTIDPSIRNAKPPIIGVSESDMDGPEMVEALRAWSRLRFIRAGWFTAKEAVAYIDYFYRFLSPLTPVVPPTFRDPSTHSKLLAEEPILTVTLLTIASRYVRLSGPGGMSRSFAVHEKLWTYLRGMIERMVWGQEQFGGGLDRCTADMASDTQTSSTAPWRGLKKGSLRTLGTVESLMLLTEWHPRALHFPPNDDGDELLTKPEPSPSEVTAHIGGLDGDVASKAHKGIGGRRIENWLEPAWRSDRMCWMLLGNALALSFELGVFDDPGTKSYGGETYRPERESVSYRIRADRIQKLLYVYVTQLAGRLEWTSMVNDLPRSMAGAHVLNGHDSAGKKGNPPETETELNRISAKDLSSHDAVDDVILDCWIEITDLMKRGNELLFPTRRVTRDIIRTGRYVELLETFQPLISSWRKKFEALRMPSFIRHILTIEGEYVRIYINSLALQAVVERCTNNGLNTTTVGEEKSLAAPSRGGAVARDRHGSVAGSTLMGLYNGDQDYIKEVVEASRSLLQTVVDGLLPEDYLKHCTVRTYFRIVSGAMFLLKTFALGATEDDVAISLGLMDRTVDALRTCIVDDVHLGIRFADLLDVLTKRVRSRFVRMATTGTTRAPSRSPGPTGASDGQDAVGPSQQAAVHNLYNYSDYSHHRPGGSAPSTSRSSAQPLANPLLGISTESIDPEDGNVSIMPPPSFNLTSHHNDVSSTGGLTSSMDVGGNMYTPDWLGLDLNPLLNSFGAGVNQTYGGGVSVGEFDLLEVLLNEMDGAPNA